MRVRHLTAGLAVVLAFAAGTTVAAEKKAAPRQHAAPKQHAVSIKGMKFVPETVEVAVGDVVVWTNEDMFPHTVSGGPLNSPIIAPGKTYRWKAEKPGEIPYQCSLHVVMKGTVRVR
jgi:plastocyanin